MIANNDPDKPIVVKLREILLHEYKENTDCRSLIFVRTRDLAVSVKNFINKDAKLKFLNANYLTGANSKKEEGGELIIWRLHSTHIFLFLKIKICF